MTRRQVQIVILCEDRQQEVFIRRFLIENGWNNHQIRVKCCPSGSQSAEQYVRDKFPEELVAYKSKNYLSIALVVVIDADKKTVKERIGDFEKKCQEVNIKFRTQKEKVAFIIPKRNIETWIHYLKGNNVDEITEYPRLEKEADCAPLVMRLVEMCRNNALSGQPPPSLELACVEYKERLSN